MPPKPRTAARRRGNEDKSRRQRARPSPGVSDACASGGADGTAGDPPARHGGARLAGSAGSSKRWLRRSRIAVTPDRPAASCRRREAVRLSLPPSSPTTPARPRWRRTLLHDEQHGAGPAGMDVDDPVGGEADGGQRGRVDVGPLHDPQHGPPAGGRAGPPRGARARWRVRSGPLPRRIRAARRRRIPPPGSARSMAGRPNRRHGPRGPAPACRSRRASSDTEGRKNGIV